MVKQRDTEDDAMFQRLGNNLGKDGIRNRLGAQSATPMISSRSIYTQHSKRKGRSQNPDDEDSNADTSELYPTGQPSLTTYLNDGNWRLALACIYALFASFIAVFFGAMGMVWVEENIVADGILAKSPIHAVFTGGGVWLAQSLTQHVITTHDPVMNIFMGFMPHRSVELGLNRHKGIKGLSNAAILYSFLIALAALGGSVLAGFVVKAFQFTTSTAPVPIGLASHYRPFFSEMIACLFIGWGQMEWYYNPSFRDTNGNPASSMGFVYALMKLFTTPYSGGSLGWQYHFGLAAAHNTFMSTIGRDYLHYYIAPFVGFGLALGFWYYTARSTWMPSMAPPASSRTRSGDVEKAKTSGATSSSDSHSDLLAGSSSSSSTSS